MTPRLPFAALALFAAALTPAAPAQGATVVDVDTRQGQEIAYWVDSAGLATYQESGFWGQFQSFTVGQGGALESLDIWLLDESSTPSSATINWDLIRLTCDPSGLTGWVSAGNPSYVEDYGDYGEHEIVASGHFVTTSLGSTPTLYSMALPAPLAVAPGESFVLALRAANWPTFTVSNLTGTLRSSLLKWVSTAGNVGPIDAYAEGFTGLSWGENSLTVDDYSSFAGNSDHWLRTHIQIAVPEPALASLALLGGGAALLGRRARARG
jgi:hypothetical protein